MKCERPDPSCRDAVARCCSFSFAERVEPRALLVGRDAGRRFEIDNRITARAKWRALVRRRQEPRRPDLRSTDRAPAIVVQHDEARQPGAFRSEAVGQPRSHGRKAGANLTGLHLEVGQRVIVRSSVDRSQECDLVDVPGDIGEQLGDVHSGLTVLLERERARHQRAGETLPNDHFTLSAERLARNLGQRGFGVERVYLTDAATHEQRDDRAWPWA